MFCRACGRRMEKGSAGRTRDPFYCTGCDKTAGRCRCRPESPSAPSGRGLAECAYWYFLMVRMGGPDGSELDAAVTEDMLYALREWAAKHPEPDYLAALQDPSL